MKDFTNTVYLLFVSSFLIQTFALVLIPVKNERKYSFISNITLVIGLAIGLISTLSLLVFSNPGTSSNDIFHNWIRLDGLSLYFLFIVQLIAIPTTIYNISYMQHYIEQSRPIKSFIIPYILLLLSTQMLVIANQAVFFLVCWEVMSMSAYIAMIFEKEKEEVQKGSFYYFAASHVLIFILYIMFFLLHHQTGSWYFSDYHLSFFRWNCCSGNICFIFYRFWNKSGTNAVSFLAASGSSNSTYRYKRVPFWGDY